MAGEHRSIAKNAVAETKMVRLLSCLLIWLLSSGSVACEDSVCFPEDNKQRMNALNHSLTTEKIFNAYMSSDVNQRRLAEMYVVGVIDSSEGVSWCGFNVASPDVIKEQVFESLKDSMKTNPQGRAANAIKSRLEELLPCKRMDRSGASTSIK